MKKILTFFTLTVLLNSCTPDCDPYEIQKNVVYETNKSYLLQNKRVDTYINQSGEYETISFNEGTIALVKESETHGCGYYTYEKVEQNFKLRNFLGKIDIGNGTIDMSLSDYVVMNQLGIYSNQSTELNQLTTNETIQGFTFTNVLKLQQTNNSEHAIWDIETILYSKTNGIEFILFRDNTWLKKVIN